MEKEIDQMYGHVSQDSFYWTKGPLTDIHGPEGDSLGNKQPQDLTVYGQICGSICLMQREAKQSKSALSRNQSSIVRDTYVASSSLKLMMKNSNIPWRTLVESWKFRCKQQCLVQHQWFAEGKLAAVLGNTGPNMLVLSMPESMRMRLEGVPPRYHEDHIGKNSLSHHKLVHKFIPMPQALKILDAKAAVGKEQENWGKYQHGIWRTSRTKRK